MKIERFDFGGYFRQRGITVPSSLVMYDKWTDAITVDTRATKAYAEFASQHERICCGDCCEFHGEKLPEPGDPTRCREVERIMLYKVIPKAKGEEYARQRVEMFHTLLDNSLNEPLEESFKESLIFLEKWLRERAWQ